MGPLEHRERGGPIGHVHLNDRPEYQYVRIRQIRRYLVQVLDGALAIAKFRVEVGEADTRVDVARVDAECLCCEVGRALV